MADSLPRDMHGPLHGVRVLDASRVLAGPFCGQILGELGAEVIKVERPGNGDDTRGWGPPFAGTFSSYFLSCNHNKKAIALDLAQQAGLDVFYQLVARSDILLENFLPASARKLGLDPTRLHRHNPRLVICSISGFGRTGPRQDEAGYDFAIQGLSGLMDITGPAEGPPSKVGVAVTDVLTGLHAAIAVLACMHAVKQSGHGYAIDLALLDCAVASQVNLAQAFLTTGVVPPRQGNAHLQIVPYQAFACADDWIILAVGNDTQWQRFCSAVGRDDLGRDPTYASNAQRVQQRDKLIPVLEALFKTRSRLEWETLLADADIPHAPVQSYADLFADPQISARGMKVTVRDPQGQPVDLLGSPFHIAGATLPGVTMPPVLGQHTDDILTHLLGLEPQVVKALRDQGVIG